jgi:alkanesulfonate monooxygenase SsuD/methylene tetrahydromethanopterin reductase-like flavin-dependent oxidoreductase (luciferase family)
MRIGVVVPTFASRAEPAVVVAKEAERKGLHGVFCFDHLWPLGEPGKPAIAPFPFLGRLSGETSTVWLGTLVARIGLVPDEVLIGEFRTLASLTGGRVIAAIGSADRLTAEENLAYGLDFLPAARRLASAKEVTEALRRQGLEVWVGAGEQRTNAVARQTGATLNVFDVDPDVVGMHAKEGPVSWAGPLSKHPKRAAEILHRLALAGATWAVVSSRNPIDEIVEAATNAEIALAA